jgi:hypothetical protein
VLRLPAIRSSVLAVGLALLLGGCASQAAPAPQAAWRLDGAQDGVHDEVEAPEAGDWTAHRTYEYRGGRDPRTGRAQIQM